MDIDQKLQDKLKQILKMNETIDVVPPEQTTTTPITVPNIYGGDIHSQPLQSQENISELINKQTEMIISIIKQLVDNQNKLIMELINSHKVPTKENNKFQEKVIYINYDDKGNPTSAEIKLKPFDENSLDLSDLEMKDKLDIDMGE